MKVRGRRFETAAYGALLGVVAYTLQPWFGLFIVFLAELDELVDRYRKHGS